MKPKWAVLNRGLRNNNCFECLMGWTWKGFIIRKLYFKGYIVYILAVWFMSEKGKLKYPITLYTLKQIPNITKNCHQRRKFAHRKIIVSFFLRKFFVYVYFLYHQGYLKKTASKCYWSKKYVNVSTKKKIRTPLNTNTKSMWAPHLKYHILVFLSNNPPSTANVCSLVSSSRACDASFESSVFMRNSLQQLLSFIKMPCM